MTYQLELGFSATNLQVQCVSVKYCSISDESLDGIVCAICLELSEDVTGQFGGVVVVQQRRVRDAMRRTDLRLGIRRRQCNVTFPLEL